MAFAATPPRIDGNCKDSAQYGDGPKVFQGAWQIVAIQTVEPVQIVPAAQPGKLAFGQLARGDDAPLLHFGRRQLAIQVIPDLAVAYRTYRRQPGMQVTSITQGYDLVDESLFQHICESLFNAVMQYLTICRSNGQVRDSIGQLLPSRCRGFGTLYRLFQPQFSHALTADPINFQRTTQALRIVRVNTRCRFRIDHCQLFVQGLP